MNVTLRVSECVEWKHCDIRTRNVTLHVSKPVHIVSYIYGHVKYKGVESRLKHMISCMLTKYFHSPSNLDLSVEAFV